MYICSSERDDLPLSSENYINISIEKMKCKTIYVFFSSTNSLDANEVGKDKSDFGYELFEDKEAVVDMYGDDYYTPDLEIDALQLVLQDYENVQEHGTIAEKEDDGAIPTGTINPIFELETTDV